MPLSANDLYSMFGGVGDALTEGRKQALVEQELAHKRWLEDQQYAAIADEAKAARGLFSGGQSGAPAAGAATPPAPSANLGGDAAAVRDQFLAPIKAAGLTNPVALATVAAYGHHESGFDPAKVNGTWSDPSQSGQPGTSGGILSWRDNRLARMQKFAESQGEKPGAISPATQGLFFAREDPELFAALQAARTPEEAHSLLANKWRFAGFNDPSGGEYASRLATTRALLPQFAGPDAGPVQVAGPNTFAPQTPTEPTTPAGRGQALGIPQPAVPPQAQPGSRTPPVTAPAAAAPPAAPDRMGTYIQALLDSPSPGAKQKGIALATQHLTKSDEWDRHVDPNGDVVFFNKRTRQEVRTGNAASAPDQVKQYEYARNQGYKGDFNTWKIEQAQAGRTNVTTNVGGGSDKQIFDEIQTSANSARAAATGLTAIQQSRRAINAGGIFGFGADERLGLQKLGAYLGIADPQQIQNTETFRSAIAPQVAAILKATVGTSQISNTDREFAEKAAGGSIKLDEGSIKRLLDIMEQGGRAIVDEHNQRLDTVYPEAEGKFKRERALFGVKVPAAPAPAPAAPAASAAPVRINSAAERDKLAPGTQYVAPDGSLRVR